MIKELIYGKTWTEEEKIYINETIIMARKLK